MGCCAALICSDVFDCPCSCCDCSCCSKWWCNCCICSTCCKNGKGRGYIGVSDIDQDEDKDKDNSKIITENLNESDKLVEIKIKDDVNEDEKANLLKDYENGYKEQSGLGPFIHQYSFLYNKKQTVILQNYFGTTLSNNTKRNKGKLSRNGGCDENAEWNVEFDGKDGDFVVVKFRNTATGKYLRIIENGQVTDCKGTRDQTFTRFKVHKINGNLCKFESCQFNQKYLGVTYDDVIGDNKGDNDMALFSVWSNYKDEKSKEIERGDQSGSGKFINNYYFNNHNDQQIIIMKGYFGKSLKVSTNKNIELDTINGSIQIEAQFIVELESNKTDIIIKLKSNKTKKYIRIIDNDKINCGGTGGKYTNFKVKQVGDNNNNNCFIFESCIYPRKYIGVKSDDTVYIGSGDKFSEFTLWSNQSDEKQTEKFETPYILTKDNAEVILKHALGQTLRI